MKRRDPFSVVKPVAQAQNIEEASDVVSGIEETEFLSAFKFFFFLNLFRSAVDSVLSLEIGSL